MTTSESSENRTPSALPGGHLRVSDADRDLVHQVLNTAYAEGRITREELDERSTAVLEARTFNDLAPVTADLMPRPNAPQQVYATPARVDEASSVVVDTSHVSREAEHVTAIMSTKKRPAGWRMRPRTSVATVMGEVRLDLTGGAMEADHCQIDFTCIMGDVVLVVPAGVQVIDETTPIMGEVSCKGLRPTSPDAPTITLRGMVLMSQVTVKGPDHVSFAQRLGLTDKK